MREGGLLQLDIGETYLQLGLYFSWELTVEVQLGIEYRFFFSPWLLLLVNNAIVNSVYDDGCIYVLTPH
jgi:hypothetical protein